MKKKVIIVVIVILILYILLYLYNNDYRVDNGLPIIDISLKDINIEEVHKDKKVKFPGNNIKIYDKLKKILDEEMTIKGRGNFTWVLDKKTYRISFEDKKQVLSLPLSKNYVLLANYLDSSLLKNDFTYSVAKRMNLNYSFTGEFVDLYIDKHYIGNYYLTPKVSISKNIVNIKDKDAVLVELDNSYFMDEDEYFISEGFFDHIVLKDTKSGDKSDGFGMFEKKYNNMEKCIYKKDYKCLKKYIEVESFVKYYIISEFASNPDSLRSSFFMYMDGKEDKIHVGPIWDFDIGYGLKPQFSDTEKLIIKDDLNDEKERTRLFYYLLKIKDFRKDVSKYWNTVAKDIYEDEIKKLDNKIKYLEKSGKYNNNYWDLEEYDKGTKGFKEWLIKRYEFFNKSIG